MANESQIQIFWNEPNFSGLGITPNPIPARKSGIIPESPIKKPQSVMDIECYSNYFLVAFKRIDSDKSVTFEMTEGRPLEINTIKDIIRRHEIITFNGNHYDIPMLRLAFSGADNAALKIASDAIIQQGLTPYQFDKRYPTPDFFFDHIDLKEVAFGQSSLKLYGGRLHTRWLKELPYDPDKTLTQDEMARLREYCLNDLDVTKELYFALFEQIQLRRDMSKQYMMDLRSKSDAQIAEEVLKAKITAATKQRPVKQEIKPKQFCYQLPAFLTYTNPQLIQAVEIVTTKPFTVRQNGEIIMPKELLTLQIKVGQSTYQMGMGGLHSTESIVHHIADDEYLLADWDVASYYPSIILNCELYPQQLGRCFLDEYRKIVETRLEAKHNGDKVKADSLKITINGSFGKLGSPYSALYAPELMVQVTVTGQLSLLMLIDRMEQNGISVVSANTDGAVMKCPRHLESVMTGIIQAWEQETGFVMERADYKALFSRDVNNYISVKLDGKVKTKGCFSTGGLAKNPQNEICSLALIEFLKSGTPFEDTIKSCQDITRFLSIRTVNGGAVKEYGKRILPEYKSKEDLIKRAGYYEISNNTWRHKKFQGEMACFKGTLDDVYEMAVKDLSTPEGRVYLGKVIRWYYAKGEKSAIHYQTNGNQVPKSIGAKPLMILPDELPDDIDYDWYIKECEGMLKNLGLRRTG